MSINDDSVIADTTRDGSESEGEEVVHQPKSKKRQKSSLRKRSVSRASEAEYEAPKSNKKRKSSLRKKSAKAARKIRTASGVFEVSDVKSK